MGKRYDERQPHQASATAPSSLDNGSIKPRQRLHQNSPISLGPLSDFSSTTAYRLPHPSTCPPSSLAQPLPTPLLLSSIHLLTLPNRRLFDRNEKLCRCAPFSGLPGFHSYDDTTTTPHPTRRKAVSLCSLLRTPWLRFVRRHDDDTPSNKTKSCVAVLPSPDSLTSIRTTTRRRHPSTNTCRCAPLRASLTAVRS